MSQADWKTMKLKELTTKIGSGTTPRGGSKVYQEEGIPFVRSQNVHPNEFRTDGLVFISEEQHQKMKSTQLRPSDVLLNITGASIGRSCMVPDGLGEANVNQHVCIIRCNGELLPAYLCSYLNSYNGQKLIYSYQAGGNREGLNFDQISRFKIPVPPLPEQKRIATILSTWDRAIELTDRLIEACERRKRGLMEGLLTGRMRLPGYGEAPWVEVRIGDVLKQVKRPVDFDDDTLYNLISVRRRSGGLFFRQALHGRDIKTKNLSIARSGDFLISKMQVVHGASGLTTEEFDGMHISGSYIALVEKNEGKLDIEFFSWLSKMPRMYHLALISSYGVHIEKMTFNLRDYLKRKIRVPESREEQEGIVAVLESSESEIGALVGIREKLMIQKSGIMSELLAHRKEEGHLINP